MKKIAILICCAIINISHAWACSYWRETGEYEIKNDQIYYNSYKSDPILVEGADMATFINNNHAPDHELVKKADGQMVFKMYPDIRSSLQKFWYSTNYASDANHVYYKGKKLPGLDPTKTILLEDKHRDGTTIEGINELELTTDGYVHDDKFVYYHGQLLTEANGTQFTRMPLYEKHRKNSYYTKDEQHIYFYGQKVAGTPKTAFELGNGYYLDDQHIYFRGEILKGALPNQFEQKSGLIISNGHVFYRNERLPLDGNTFQELDHKGSVGCLSDISNVNILSDKNGIYRFTYTGEIPHASYTLKPVEISDHKTFRLLPEEKYDIKGWSVDDKQVYFLNSSREIQPVSLNRHKSYQETYKLDERSADTFYRDNNAIYITSNQGAQNLSATLEIDPQSLHTFATLWEAIIFKDNKNYYIESLAKYTPTYKKIIDSNAKLVCLGKNHLCLLHENTLYYIFDDGNISQEQVNSEKLHCITDDILLSHELEQYVEPGLCFDDQYVYGKDKKHGLYWKHQNLLYYTTSNKDIEEKRLRSLDRLHIERQPFLSEPDQK